MWKMVELTINQHYGINHMFHLVIIMVMENAGNMFFYVNNMDFFFPSPFVIIMFPC